jgi:pimeloyl-ACP methyl ester carboxylesterase
MPKAKVSDIEMYYEIVGQGAPLLMTSGWSLANRAFAKLIPHLQDKYQCIRHDHRNMGRSDAPDRPASIAQMADDLAGLLDHLKIERTRVLGAGGMGGLVAMEFAIRHPDRTTALHLGSPSLKVDNFLREVMEVWKALRHLDVRLWAREVTLWCFTPGTFESNPELVKHAFEARAAENTFPAPNSYDRIVDAYVNYDARTTAAQIRCPTLVTSGGTEDLITGPRFAREVHESIPGSQLKVFEGTSHGYSAEAEAEFVRLIVDWFAANGAASPSAR